MQIYIFGNWHTIKQTIHFWQTWSIWNLEQPVVICGYCDFFLHKFSSFQGPWAPHGVYSFGSTCKQPKTAQDRRSTPLFHAIEKLPSKSNGPLAIYCNRIIEPTSLDLLMDLSISQISVRPRQPIWVKLVMYVCVNRYIYIYICIDSQCERIFRLQVWKVNIYCM